MIRRITHSARRILEYRIRDRRGVALVIVLVVIAMMSTYAIEFTFKTRVNMEIASNTEREVVAYFNARSAIQITRLVVGSEKIFMQKFGGLLNAMRPKPKVEMWRFSTILVNFFAQKSLTLIGIKFADLKKYDGLGTSDGTFSLKSLELEDSKINVNRLGLTTKNVRALTYRSLRNLFMTKKKEFFKDDEERIDKLILSMIDWIDPDDNRIGLNSQVDVNKQISFVEQSGGYGEDSPYSEHGYKSKDANFDTVEELMLVDGMTDEIFDAFGDKITVYKTQNININEADSETLKALVCDHVAGQQEVICPPPLVQLTNLEPAPIDIALRHYDNCRRLKKLFFTPMFSDAKYFRSAFLRLPSDVPVRITIKKSLDKVITTDSRVLRVVALGKYGKTQYTINAVMDLKKVKWLYWRESTGY